MIEPCHTRPDFTYQEQVVVIYIDGPDHDRLDIAARDAEVSGCLLDLGYTVIRFGYRRSEWAAICAEHAYVFGKGDFSNDT